MGAWIEIPLHSVLRSGQSSLPSWERGLKFLKTMELLKKQDVAPLVGAWIEIILISLPFTLVEVAPLVGAWIEI